MKSETKQKRKFLDIIKNSSKPRVLFLAWSGNNEGLVRANNNGGVYIRDINNGKISIVYSKIYPINPNRLLEIGYPENSKTLQVLREINYFDNSVLPSETQNYPESFTWPNVNTAYIARQQILMFLGIPISGFVVQVIGGIYSINGVRHLLQSQQIDLEAEAITDGAKWCLVEVDEDGVIDYRFSDLVDNKDLLVYEDIPEDDSNKFSLLAIALYAGQTELLKNQIRQDVIDLALWSSSSGGGSLPALDPARVAYTDPSTGDLKTSDDLIFNETDNTFAIGDPAGTGDGDGSYLHGFGGDKTHTGILSTFHNLVTYAGDNARASLVKLITSLGTKASPLAVTLGTLLGRIRFAGYDGDTRVVDSATSADIKALATEDFDASGHGTKIVISTTPNNSTAMQDVVEFDHHGQVKFNEYGSGIHTGTLAKLLGVNASGNVIETYIPIDYRIRRNMDLGTPFGERGGANALSSTSSVNMVRYVPVYFNYDLSISQVRIVVGTTHASSRAWVGVYNNGFVSGEDTPVGSPIVVTDEINCSSSGIKSSDLSFVFEGNTLYWVALLTTSSGSFFTTSLQGYSAPVIGWQSSTLPVTYLLSTSVTSFPTDPTVVNGTGAQSCPAIFYS